MIERELAEQVQLLIQQHKEPLLTWNLFWTTVLVPACLLVFGWWMKRQDKKKEDNQKDKEKLQSELLELKEKGYDEWRTRFVDGLCSVKNDVKALTAIIPTIITQKDCEESHDIIKDILDSHGNRITALEHEINHLRKRRIDHVI